MNMVIASAEADRLVRELRNDVEAQMPPSRGQQQIYRAHQEAEGVEGVEGVMVVRTFTFPAWSRLGWARMSPQSIQPHPGSRSPASTTITGL